MGVQLGLICQRKNTTGLVWEEHWGEAIGYGETYLRNSHFVLFTSYYYSVTFMEDEKSRKWGMQKRNAYTERDNSEYLWWYKVDLKQLWYQDLQEIHGSIQLEVFCGNNNKVWVLWRQMNDYWLLKSNCTQHRQSVDQLISYLWTTVIKSQR